MLIAIGLVLSIFTTPLSMILFYRAIKKDIDNEWMTAIFVSAVIFSSFIITVFAWPFILTIGCLTFIMRKILPLINEKIDKFLTVLEKMKD